MKNANLNHRGSRRNPRRLRFETLAQRRVLAVTANFFTSIIADPVDETLATATVNVDDAAKLDAWIDFNGNGLFDHPSEHLAGGNSIDVSAGANLITIPVPAGASPSLVAGTTLVRFLTSEDGDLLPTDVGSSDDTLDATITILDAAVAPDVELDITGNQINLSAGLSTNDEPELLVSNRNTVLFRAPRAAVGSYVVTADEFSNVLQLDFASGDPLPEGGIDFDGGDRVDTVRLIGGAADLDLSESGNIVLKSIDVIDVSDSAIQNLILDAAAASAIDPDGGGIVIVGGSEDLVQFADQDAWSMNAPEVVAGLVFNVVASDDTFVQVDFGSGWQNLVSPGDINNSGSVTENDALLIVNELQRGRFSDPDTELLDNAADIDPWPNVYYDQNNDGNLTALDALRVINEIARTRNSSSGDGELLVSAPVDAYFAKSSLEDADDEDWSDTPIKIF